MRCRWVHASVLGALLAGCAGSLQVFDANQKPLAGMPFHTVEVYVKTGTHNKASKGGTCDRTRFVETVSLPTGPQYYVTATTAQLAKTAFHIKYTEMGAVAEVSLDSEPAGADNIRATTDLIKALAPLAGVTPRTLSTESSAPACDAGEVNVVYCRLEDYIDGRCNRS